jgi:hypothetical protein
MQRDVSCTEKIGPTHPTDEPLRNASKTPGFIFSRGLYL